MILELDEVEELSLDHDLGLAREDGRELTGYDVFRWIEKQVATVGFVPPKLSGHSANPPGHERMPPPTRVSCHRRTPPRPPR